MAKIEDLVSRIEDESLRAAISAEVKELKKTKRFGLVFEEHLPETVRLPNVPVRKGCLVAKKAEKGNACWEVKNVSKGQAECKPLASGKMEQDKESIPVNELVVVKPFGEPIFPTLTPIDRVARGGPDKPWHTLINADNFHALQLLLYCYEGKVDVIYIDPPYNSGAKDWKYNNNYVDGSDPWRHSKWLSFIERRLTLAKRLLKPNGVLVVTIDEHEMQHLGCLLEDMFPESRRQVVTIVNNAAGVTQGGFYRVEEYALFCFFGDSKPQSLDDDFLMEQSKKASPAVWFSLIRYGGINSRPSKRKGLVYPIAIDPDNNRIIGTGKTLADRVEEGLIKEEELDQWRPDPDEDLEGYPVLWPYRSDGSIATWQLKPDTLLDTQTAGFVRVRPHKKGLITNKWSVSYIKSGNQKKILSGEIPTKGRDGDGPYIIADVERNVVPKTVWKRSLHDAGKWGSRALRQTLGSVSFDYAKSPYAVIDTLRTITPPKAESLIVDFFAGSGTTFHATALLNKIDGGKRRSILITNNEVEVNRARNLAKNKIYPGDAEYEAEGICESITWPRCRNVVNGSMCDGTTIDENYEVFDEIGDSIAIRDGLEENLEYFRLDFMDSSDVERGDAFEGILPILWMMAGCIGEREDRRGSTPFYIAKHSPFAVLIKEGHFAEFAEKLAEREDIKHVFLVTDSEENFAMMRRELGGSYRCYQLYKSYLENFRLNAADPSLTGTKA